MCLAEMFLSGSVVALCAWRRRGGGFYSAAACLSEECGSHVLMFLGQERAEGHVSVSEMARPDTHSPSEPQKAHRHSHKYKRQKWRKGRNVVVDLGISSSFTMVSLRKRNTAI